MHFLGKSQNTAYVTKPDLIPALLYDPFPVTYAALSIIQKMYILPCILSVTGYDHDSAIGILDLINDRKSSFFFYESFRALDICFNDLLLRMTIAAAGLMVSMMISYSFIPFTSFILMQFFSSYTYILS